MVEVENVFLYGYLNHIQLHFAMDQLQHVLLLEIGDVINAYLRTVDHVVVDQLVMQDHLEVALALETANVHKCILQER
jgi:hypothetical protein